MAQQGQGQASCLLNGPVVLGGVLCAPGLAASPQQSCYHSTAAMLRHSCLTSLAAVSNLQDTPLCHCFPLWRFCLPAAHKAPCSILYMLCSSELELQLHSKDPRDLPASNLYVYRDPFCHTLTFDHTLSPTVSKNRLMLNCCWKVSLCDTDRSNCRRSKGALVGFHDLLPHLQAP